MLLFGEESRYWHLAIKCVHPEIHLWCYTCQLVITNHRVDQYREIGDIREQ